ncbi:hypothetical protein CCE01nite_11590 [Cellulomonas cellasea]|uniref:Uncharacterized protein n=1 Tax=Cellulomonas cellasea TaxID=43670 RepID=A0A4Y3KWB6_9CELL|nr:hypothetical protein CCE01nite_11590 [Cellulomonas cellasea]
MRGRAGSRLGSESAASRAGASRRVPHPDRARRSAHDPHTRPSPGATCRRRRGRGGGRPARRRARDALGAGGVAGPDQDGPEPGRGVVAEAVDVRTADGLRVGDPLSAVHAAHPDLRGPGSRTPPAPSAPYFSSVGEFPVSYAFVTEGTDPGSPVTTVLSGWDCGE